MDLSYDVARVAAAAPDGKDCGGDADALSVLFLHGNGFCRQVWDGVLDELSRSTTRPFTAFRADLRRHGESRFHGGAVAAGAAELADVATDGLRTEWHIHAADVLRLARHIRRSYGPRRLILVAHSLGATAGLLAEHAQPALFDAAVVAEPITVPIAKAAGLAENPLAATTRRRRWRWASRREMDSDLAPALRRRRWDERALEGYLFGGFASDAGGAVTMKCSVDDELLMYTQSPGNGLFEALSRLTALRTLIALAGSRVEAGELVAATARHVATLSDGDDGVTVDSGGGGGGGGGAPWVRACVVVSGAGHNVPMEQPAKVAKVVLSVLEQNCSAPLAKM